WLKARQVAATVDAVDHLLQLDRVAAFIEALIGVAELAQADLSPAAAMLGQRLVAVVAFRRRGDLPDGRDRPSGRHAVQQWIRDETLRADGPLDLAPDRVRLRRREARGQCRREGVRVDAMRLVDRADRAAAVVPGLPGRRYDVVAVAREADRLAFGARGVD